MELSDLAGMSVPPITALILGSRTVPGYSPPIAALSSAGVEARIIAVDVTPDDGYPPNWEFCPALIGTPSTGRKFYHANADICSSLFPFNWDCINLYDELALLATVGVERVDVIGLDEFTAEKRPIHFIAADIQGAELEAFQSGPATLADTLMIQAEAQIAPIYAGAPMWRDVDAGLDAMGFTMYRPLGHKAMSEVGESGEMGGGGGRSMWGEWLYVRKDFGALDTDALLRLAVLAHISYQPHLAARCLEGAAGRAMAAAYIALVKKSLDVSEKGEGQ